MSFSWQTGSSAPAPVAALRGDGGQLAAGVRALVRRTRPELLLLVALAALLDMWALSRNGWANDYYSAAVRSMSSSWHDFLYASLDRSGVMTVDKPPLALWVQALSVRVFGFHSLSVLVPQALMGVASVALLYDLVRRTFGRFGGFVAGLALAVTPMMVAVSRHNNPDALLVLCSVAAVWCALRALQSGRTRWLVAAGVCVGLGFETKMGVALVVVPGIALAWLWCTPAGRGRLHALRQLLAGGAAMVLVGGAWPALVELTPASARPWVSGTGDNRVLSLIFGYNGLGRVDGQTGGPLGAGGQAGGGPGGGTMFGGTAGPLRLLNSALGGQAGWLLGFALVGLLAILVATRLRRADRRTGWLLVVGGAFATTAVLFSWASGIFHPYYVSLLAPFAAALIGAGAAQLLRAGAAMRVLAPCAVVAGLVTELVVRADYPGQLTWLPPLLIAVTAACAIALLAARAPRGRAVALSVALAAMMIAPAAWAFDTLGYATSGTFPAGGPQAAALGGAPFGGMRRLGAGASAGRGSAFLPPGAGEGALPPGAGRAGAPPSAGGPPAGGPIGVPGAPGATAGGSSGGLGLRAGAAGSPFGDSGSVSGAVAYVKQHGGGTIAVSSQSSAASAILSSGASVAGIGGFSGRESSVSVAWLAQAVRAGKIRWVLADQQGASGSGAPAFGALRGSSSSTARGLGLVGAGGPSLPGDTRSGSRTAIAAAESACRRVTFGRSSGSATLYDCSGRASALAARAN